MMPLLSSSVRADINGLMIAESITEPRFVGIGYFSIMTGTAKIVRTSYVTLP